MQLNKKFIITILSILFSLLLLVAWNPWLSDEGARTIAIESFNKVNMDSQDGCSLLCENCGSKEVKGALFGSYVTIEYNCIGGPVEELIVQPDNYTITVFVSFLGKAKIQGFE